ncbi:uncharacterized protein LOC134258434 [Saccostrea cucullata]|uniref:uncharacterized protein LOC134258434 n=1 Tax=Saccostrea cuccullata TaxID=36930 RepID=UPI002ED23581
MNHFHITRIDVRMLKNIIIHLQAVLLFTTNVVTGYGPLCMKCQDATTIEECRQQYTVPCGDRDDCFLRKYTTDNAEIRFEAGCLAKSTCSILNSFHSDNPVGKRNVDLLRTKKEVTNCFQCCNGSLVHGGPCNSHLCGQAPGPELVTCKMCPGVHDHIESCSHEDVCPPGEACYTGIRIVGSVPKYVFGCAKKRICRSLASDNVRETREIHGDIGLSICDACCIGINCNEAECFALKNVMKYSDYVDNTTSTTFG